MLGIRCCNVMKMRHLLPSLYLCVPLEESSIGLLSYFAELRLRPTDISY